MENELVSMTEVLAAPNSAGIADDIDGMEVSDEALCEAIWEELGGRFDRVQIRQLLLEAVAKYETASVTNYLPIMLRRYVLEKLR